jgi:hypothetical protein
MTSRVTPANQEVFKPAGLRETTVLLAVAWAVPFLVHLIPWTGARPLGVYLLPMFWTTFVAVYFYGATVGLVVGLFAPAVNLVVTGLPAGRYAAESALELLAFASASAWAVRRWPRLVVTAPLGYVVARLAWAEWVALTDPAVQLQDVRSAGRSILHALVNGAPGLLVLLGANIALAHFYPKDVAAKPSALTDCGEG